MNGRFIPMLYSHAGKGYVLPLSRASKFLKKEVSGMFAAVAFLFALQRAWLFPLLLVFLPGQVLFASTARDIMGGGSGGGGGKGGAANLQNAGAASASLTATRAREVLKQTDAQVAAMKTLQASARAIMTPSSFNGVDPNGLLPSATVKWNGASISSADVANTVNIQQTKQNAYLYWDKFNVGSKTTVNFDQSAGGNDVGNWIAFNKVMGNVSPSHIYGSISAQGQVYILNQNGIIFHNGSQVNTHALVASSLPINPYFAGDPASVIPAQWTGQGMLNNPGYQFLFSALPLTQSSSSSADNFNPGTIAASQVGAVVVEQGATITAPTTGSHNGGKVMLVGSSVQNSGTISTPDGQTILAAGLQVGVNAHPSSDPSLRGLDVYVGKVADAKGATVDRDGNQVGSVLNKGIISIPRGDVAIAGKKITQNGVIDSSTSVSLNGRVDIQAFYNAVVSSKTPGVSSSAYFYDGSLPGGASGSVDIGPESVIRILPEWGSSEKAVGSGLVLPSIVNIAGNAIQVGNGATIFAPGATVQNPNNTTFYDMTYAARTSADIGSTLLSGISLNAGNWWHTPSPSFDISKFILGSIGSLPAGSISIANGATISAAGSTGVDIPISQNYLTLQLRGNELANSPLQRSGKIRGFNITIDTRLTGTYNGQYWVGTPLGDATGFVGLIDHTAGELTAAGGTITLNAGERVDLAAGSKLDVSGGWVKYAGGYGATTKLVYQGHLVDISQATPDRSYSGIYSGGGTVEKSVKWGITKTFGKSPLDPTQTHYEPSYVSGAAGGSISIQAPAMDLSGSLVGNIVTGPRQIRSTATLSTLPSLSSLNLHVNNISTAGPDSPYAPNLTFVQGGGVQTAANQIIVNTDYFNKGGIGSLSVNNHDGTISLSQGVVLAMAPQGTIKLDAANISLDGSIIAPGGSISATTYDFSYAEVRAFGAAGGSPTTANSSKGNLKIGSSVVLSTAGIFSSNRGASAFATPIVSTGGSITLSGYQVSLGKGSVLDVSGGGLINPGSSGTIYGDAGSISIIAGKDPESDTVTGGALVLGSILRGYAGPGAKAGTLSISAPAIQIGGVVPNNRVVRLSPDFFNQGGFSTFTLTGVGISSGSGLAEDEIPGILLTAGTVIHPTVHSQVITPQGGVREVVLPQGARPAVALNLSSTGVKTDIIVIRGKTVLESGSRIELDPQISLSSSTSTTLSANPASLTVKGKITQIDGSLVIPGGTISLTGSGSYPENYQDGEPYALPTLTLGADAVVSAAGTVLRRADPLGLGRNIGTVLPGGLVSLSGNINLASGSLIDVSGASGEVFVPESSTLDAPSTLARSTLLGGRHFTSTQTVDSSGGSIVLTGSEELIVSGTLLGRAGGPTATGGSLTVSSGRFVPNALITDPTLQVFQSKPELAARVVSDQKNALSYGYFAVDSAMQGGFDHLVLGGNASFNGPVDVSLPGSIKVATSGVISADSAVSIKAPYVALGQPFAGSLAPGNGLFSKIFGSDTDPYVPPTFGPGSLTVQARILDVGNLLFQNIGKATLDASGGVIRGDGTLDIAGNLVLKAAQIYPVTATSFTLAAYDHGTSKGYISIEQAGGPLALPLSAAGTISLYATTINQNGTLVAPFGTINLGWDGTGASPIDPISGAGQAGGAATLPTTASLVLGSKSVTSVSAIDPTPGVGITIPYGVIIGGTQWIDPTGVDISSAGLASKGVNLSGISISTAAGSVIDLRGGGNLAAYHWVSGLQGSIDPTAQPIGKWSSTIYQVGQKVTENGAIYSARSSSTTPQPEPTKGANWQLYWSKVPESYAIIPGYSSDLLPISTFADTTQTGGDPGYTSSSLSVGDRLTIAAGAGLRAGSYTLLPSRYAVLPGAYLITPQGAAQGSLPPSAAQSDGSAIVAGYRFNDLNASRTIPTITSLYTVDSPKVISNKAEYQLSLASSFLPSVQLANPVNNAASLVVKATTAMNLLGGVMGNGANGGRGANIDLTSPADFLVGNASSVAPAGTILLDSSVLSSWSAGSLLIGGTRKVSISGESITPSTSKITVDNSGATLSASEVILASKNEITLNAGSTIVATGSDSEPSVFVSGNGALLRLSGDEYASVTRTGFNSLAAGIKGFSIGANTRISANSITLDSSGAASIASSAVLNAKAINLDAGKIALNFDGSTESGALNLSGNALGSLSSVERLSLTSYSTIDFHGSGLLGSPSLASLALHAGEIVGDNNSTDTIQAGEVLIDNMSGSTDPSNGSPGATGGSLSITGSLLTLGPGAISLGGFKTISGTFTGGIQGIGVGSFAVGGDLNLSTPIITGQGSAATTIRAAGALNIGFTGTSELSPQLGNSIVLKGATVAVEAPIVMPSGSVTIESTAGSLTISSLIDVGGVVRNFFDVTKYTDAGAITLSSDLGNIILASGSTLNLSAQEGGGSAGSLSVSAPKGTASLNGVMKAAAPSGLGGSMIADLGSYNGGNLDGIESLLTGAGFSQSQNIRIRTGDLTLSSAKAHSYTLSADSGAITVNGTIDASGTSGGSISLFAGKSLVLNNGATLSVHGQQYDDAGKGGSIDLEAGNNATYAVIAAFAPGSSFANGISVVDLKAGSRLDLGVDATPGLGQASGILHLGAPQTADYSDLQINPIAATISGASSIYAEGVYRQDAATAGTAVIDPGTGDPLLDYQNNSMNNADAFMANYTAISSRIGTPLSSATTSLLHVTPSEVIANSLGSLVLNNDWDLSLKRYGDLMTVLDPLGNAVAYSGIGSMDVYGNQAIGKNAGFLSLRAKGDITLLGSISDGFGDSVNNAANVPDSLGGIDGLYFAPLLPFVADQNGVKYGQSSWAYRIAAGADLSSANPLSVIKGSGSVKLGKPTQTSNTINPRGSSAFSSYTPNALTGNYQVIRTGTGDISVAAGGNILLLNQFATIYTAGAQTTDPTLGGTFDVHNGITVQDNINSSPNTRGNQDPSINLGIYQQPDFYPSQFAFGGGNVSLFALGDIAHLQKLTQQYYTDPITGTKTEFQTPYANDTTLTADSSRQLPNNWLSRRGQLDSSGGWMTDADTGELTSTSWWINYANFFEGVGALGGGNVSMIAGGNISNVDAVIPTQGRMTARDGAGNLLAPAAGTLVESGGGDLTVKTGGNLDAGVYFVERGNATLKVAGSIVTNKTRDVTGNYLASLVRGSIYKDPGAETYLPTSFFLGKGSISVTAGGNALLGPVGNAFLLPQSINDGVQYKTYFSTYNAASSFSASSLGGAISYRSELLGSPAFQKWMISDKITLSLAGRGGLPGDFQPWLRVVESSPGFSNLGLAAGLLPGTLSLTSLGGDINLQGNLNLSPSPSGELSLFALGSINGVYQQQLGKAWSTSEINVSDANPSSVPSIISPGAQATLQQNFNDLYRTSTDYLATYASALVETASYTGANAVLKGKIARHDQSLLHSGDSQPVRIYASGGDLSGLQLYSPKQTDIFVGGDISDVALAIQQVSSSDVSIISAGGDMKLYDVNTASLSKAAHDLVNAQGIVIPALPRSGDIQISGPGTLEVLAGGTIDLGNGKPNSDGTGVGIVSIGNARNPALPFAGADLVVAVGVDLPTGLSAGGLYTTALLKKITILPDADLYFGELKSTLVDTGNDGLAAALASNSITSVEGIESSSLSDEQKARLALNLFYIVLRDAGRDHNKVGTAGYHNYSVGEIAIRTLLTSGTSGDLLMKSRDIRTKSGGAINLLAPSGGISLSPYAVSASLIPPGIVTEDGGSVNIYSRDSVSIGIGRIFTLRGGDIMIWSDTGDIAAGASSKTVATAPPTRVLLDPQSGNVLTDLSGLATGGGIGVLATVADVPPGNVDLIAPNGVIDAGDAGIRSTGNLNLAATKILNADNIVVSGTTAGTPPAAPPPAAPNVSGATAASTAAAASTTAAANTTKSNATDTAEPPPSVITVEVLGYGGGDGGVDAAEFDSSKATNAPQASR